MLTAIVLLVMVIAIAPAAPMVKRSELLQKIGAFTIGVFPFLGIDQLTLDFFEHLGYRGEAISLQVSVIDIVGVTLILALPRTQGAHDWWISRGFYAIFVGLTILWAPQPHFAFFSFFKLLRAFLIFAAVQRIAMRPLLLSALTSGFAIGVGYNLLIALKQRYVEGYFQVQGTFEHSNSLGMAVNLVFPMAMAVVLAGHARRTAYVAVVGAAVCVVLALSRGALGMFVFAAGIVMVGSLVRGVTGRKVGVGVLLLLAGLGVLAKSWDSLVERFVTAPTESVAARDRFEAAAENMLHDFPFGIGINQYSHVLEHGGYADRFNMPEIDRDGLAHHIYWLTAAELGWIGSFAYLLLIFFPTWTAFLGAYRLRGNIRGDILLGCAAGTAAMHVHGLAEWIARQMPMMYLFWTVAAIISVLGYTKDDGRTAS